MQPIKSGNDKFVRKYMKVAKLLTEDVPCLSRGIGVVIVNPNTNCIISTGYNGLPKGLPNADSYEFLSEYVWPQLTQEDKEYLVKSNDEGHMGYSVCESAALFASKFTGCKQCPRKLIGARSGERLDLCGCAHGERNAINNAASCGHATKDCWMYAYCGVPCVECADAIINAQLSRVYCLTEDSGPINNTYASWRSEKKFKWAGVELIKVNKEWINDKG